MDEQSQVSYSNEPSRVDRIGSHTPSLVIWGLSFQALWFFTVELASQQRSYLAACLNLIWVGVLIVSRPRSQRRSLCRWGIGGLVIGTVGDGLILRAGLYSPHETISGMPTPIWLLAMWISFAVFVPLSLPKLLMRPILAIMFGCLGGPLSYFAGVRWGAMSFGSSAEVALLSTGLLWGSVMYLASYFWRRSPLVQD